MIVRKKKVVVNLFHIKQLKLNGIIFVIRYTFYNPFVFSFCYFSSFENQQFQLRPQTIQIKDLLQKINLNLMLHVPLA